MKLPRHPGAGVALLVLLTVCAVLPTSVRAQDSEGPDSVRAQNAGPDSVRLTRFARAHIAIAEARDDFHGEVARVHDEEGRLRAREQVDERITQVLEANGLTREEYDELILLISLDGELRAAFDEIVVQLQEEPSAPA